MQYPYYIEQVLKSKQLVISATCRAIALKGVHDTVGHPDNKNRYG